MGKITIGVVPELPEVQTKLEEIQELSNELEGLQNPETEADVLRIGEIANELTSLVNELNGITLSLTNSSGRTLTPVQVTLTSDPMDLPGELSISAGSDLGTLESATGSTNFIATFTPNGKYGTVTFSGSAGGTDAADVSLVITGETRAEAQERLDEKLAKIDQAKALASTLNAALAALAGAIVGGILH